MLQAVGLKRLRRLENLLQEFWLDHCSASAQGKVCETSIMQRAGKYLMQRSKGSDWKDLCLKCWTVSHAFGAGVTSDCQQTLPLDILPFPATFPLKIDPLQ